MPTCATYRPLQQLIAYYLESVGAFSAGIRHTYAYSTTQTFYIQVVWVGSMNGWVNGGKRDGGMIFLDHNDIFQS